MTKTPAFRGPEPGTAPVIPPHPRLGAEELAYCYADAGGRPLFYVCRYRTEDGKTFLQGHPGANGAVWTWNLRGLTPVIYHFDLVTLHLGAGKPGPVFIVEGEKDVDRCIAAMAAEGIDGVATCNPMGAGKWRDHYSDALTGARHVIVVADNDEPGRKHARQVEASLRKVVDRVELKRPAVDHPKADLSDHLDAGLTLEELLPLDEPTEVSTLDLAAGEVFMDAYEFANTSEVPPPPLWGTDETMLLPEAGLAIIAGRPGTGKTTLIVDLIAHLAAGLPWPPVDETTKRAPEPWPVARPLRIGLIENEGPRELFRDKLRRKLGVFPLNINEAGGYLGVQNRRWGAFSLADDDDFVALRAELDDKRIDLVVGDPLNMLGVEGVGSPEDTRRFIHRLRLLGLGTTRAFLLIHHFRERVESNEDELRKLSGAWSGHLDSLITLANMGVESQARLAFPKLRWARGELPKPAILGRVYAIAGFEALGLEDDVARLEPDLVAGLEALREAGEGYGGLGWITSRNLATHITAAKGDAQKALEGASHLFVMLEGEAVKALGAKRTSKLWGLRSWPEATESRSSPAVPTEAPELRLVDPDPDAGES